MSNRMMGLWGAIIGLLVLGVAIEAGPTNYTTATVKPADRGKGLHVSGHVIAQDGAQCIEAARVQGRILSILKKEGDYVDVGTPLFVISSAEALTMTQELATAKRQNAGALIDAIKQRQTQLGLLIQNGEFKLVATHSGVITKRFVETGASFNIGDPLVTLLKTNQLAIELDVPESELAKVKTSQPVRLKLATNMGAVLTTSVQTILPIIDASTRTVKVRLRPIRLPAQTALDTLVFAEIQTPADASMLIVPSEAIVFRNDHRYVLKKESNRLLPVAVDVVSQSEKTSLIRCRQRVLQAGDTVVASNAIFVLQNLEK